MLSSRTSIMALLGVCLLAVVVTAPVRAQETAQGQASDQEAQAGSEAPAGDWQPVGAFGEEISVDVVNVDVWVTDEDGRPVTGLTKKDFGLFEDGEPRKIVNFAAFEGSATAPARAEAPPWAAATDRASVPAPEPAEGVAAKGAAAEGAATDQPPSARMHLVVLVDNWNLRPESRARVFADLREFIASNLHAGDQVAIMVHDRALQLVQGFSDDPRRVAATLDRIEKVAPSGIEVGSARKSALAAIEQAYREWNETGSTRVQGSPCNDGWGQMQNAATQYAATVQGHVQRSGGALVSVADLLSGLPDGQRVVVYVGNGLAQTPGLELFQLLTELCPHRQSELGFYYRDYDMSWLYQEVAKHANAAGVTFFTIEAESPAVDLGIDSLGPGGGSAPYTREGSNDPADEARNAQRGIPNFGPNSGGPGVGPSFTPSPTAQSLRSRDQEGSLVLIAQETGGRSFLNAADFSSDFERLALDLRNYYSLGFNPEEPGDGKLHPIEVRLTDGRKVRIRHRTQYQDKPLEVRMVERVRGVAQFGEDQNPLHVRIEVGEAVPEEVAFRVPVRIWVPLDGLTLVPKGEGGKSGELQGRLRVLMTTTSASGELQPVRQKVVPVTVRGGAKGLARDQLIEVEVELPPGEQTIALAVRDGYGGTTSYLHHTFRVAAGAVEASVH